MSSTFASASTSAFPSPSPSPSPTSLRPRHDSSRAQTTLSLLVILPDTEPIHQIAGPSTPSKPSPLTSRQSASRVPTRGSPGELANVEDVIAAGRRLSLAPGLGAGPTRYRPTTSSSPRLQIPAPNPASLSPSGSVTDKLTDSPESSVPAFGSRSPLNKAKGSRRRPVTAASPSVASRSSMAVDGVLGSGRIGGAGKARPGWEGDELVGMLRASGQEVTVVRTTAQVSSILSPQTTSPTFSTFTQQTLTASGPSSITPVILVPLCDQPTLPSLSLLLQQGTTPTAVCFQQDLLERARQAELEWLPTALERVQAAVRIKDEIRLNTDPSLLAPSTSEPPIILGYSANPALSPHTIFACVSVGASGVLKPPYDLETARMVRRMARAAKEGRISSVVGLPIAGDPTSPTGEEEDPFGRVVLPPTTLSMGAEHAGEIALSGAIRSHRQRRSSLMDSRSPSPLSITSRRESNLGPRKGGLGRGSSSDPRKRDSYSRPIPNSTSTKSLVTPISTTPPYSLPKARPSLDGRRKSVDISGLELALRRAQHAFEQPRRSPRRARFAPITPLPAVSTPRDEGPLGETRQSVPDVGSSMSIDPPQTKEMELAELLSSLYLQTQMAIRVQVSMDEYDRLSVPLSAAQRHSLVDAIATWSFRPQDLEEGDLFRVAWMLFEAVLSMEGLVELDLKRDQVNRFLFAIRAIYHAPNPYHNYIHAIDVLQATYVYLCQLDLVPPFEYIRSWTPSSAPWRPPPIDPSLSLGSQRAREIVRPQDVLATMIAAMAHDIGHPGLSNAFMKNAQTPLCIVYDDKSVLENMHCVLIVQLLRKHGFGFLMDPRHANAPPDPNPHRAALDARSFKRMLYSSILATDMSLHFTWVQGVQDFQADLEHRTWAGIKVPPETDEEERVIVAQAVIKCADVSNPTRPIDISEYWSSALLREWAVQASLEVDLDLPVSVIASADTALQAKGQVGFIDLFCQPLFDTIADLLPELQRYAKWCADNRRVWFDRLIHARANPPIMSQPLLFDASQDKRYSTLFPMSLPTNLVAQMQMHAALGGLEIDMTSPGSDILSSFPQPLFTDTPQSDAARAMRAVYHTLGPKARERATPPGPGLPGLSLGGAGVGGGGFNLQQYLETRRSSNPDILPSHVVMGQRS